MGKQLDGGFKQRQREAILKAKERERTLQQRIREKGHFECVRQVALSESERIDNTFVKVFVKF